MKLRSYYIVLKNDLLLKERNLISAKDDDNVFVNLKQMIRCPKHTQMWQNKMIAMQSKLIYVLTLEPYTEEPKWTFSRGFQLPTKITI